MVGYRSSEFEGEREPRTVHDDVPTEAVLLVVRTERAIGKVDPNVEPRQDPSIPHTAGRGRGDARTYAPAAEVASHEDRHIDSYKRPMVAVQRALGLRPLSHYALGRHSVASQAVTSWHYIKAVQAQYGRRSEQSTHMYAHLGSQAQLRLVVSLKPSAPPHGTEQKERHPAPRRPVSPGSPRIGLRPTTPRRGCAAFPSRSCRRRF